jgi:hypothetical protein
VAAVPEFRLPVTSGSIRSTTIELLDPENGGSLKNFGPGWNKTGDSVGVILTHALSGTYVKQTAALNHAQTELSPKKLVNQN